MAVAAVIAVGSGIWAALSGLPPVIVTIIFFAALAVALAVPHYALVWWGRLRTRRPPPELKEEVVAIQRELIRLHNRREISGGSLWPTERPYRDLPAKEWGTHADKLRLRREDREAVAQAYELARRFNDQMLLGETTIASSPDVEPDLDGLRKAFNRAAAALGLPPAPATAKPVLGQQPPPLADLLDNMIREGMELVSELSVPVQPEKTAKGWKIDGGGPSAEQQEKADAFRQRAGELLEQRNPALLADYRDGCNDYIRKASADGETSDPSADKRSDAEKMLALASAERRTAAWEVEVCLEGLAWARKAI